MILNTLRRITFAILGLLWGSAAAIAQDVPAGNPAWGAVVAERNRCFECHGEGGHGVQPGWPKLAGQYELYLLNQMRAFRAGKRPHEFMELFVSNLSDDDFIDLASYFWCQGPEGLEVPNCKRQR